MGIILQKVALNEVRFFSYHGFYPEEQLTGNLFLLDIETEFEVTEQGSDNLEKTINYERLFEIASLEMNQTRKLLETVAFNILDQVKREFHYVLKVRVVIRKMNPALNGQVGNSLVELNYIQ
jgi:dihydroneopterin aldolase